MTLKDITAKQYFTVMDCLDKAKKDEITDNQAAKELIMIFGLGKNTQTKANGKLSEILGVINGNAESKFERVFSINGTVYALEPKFEAMEAGAYQDICSQIEIGGVDAMLSVVAILYRPVVKQLGDKFYDIASYVEESQAGFEARKELLGVKLNASGIRGLLDFFTSSAVK